METDNQFAVDILIITALTEEQEVLQQYFNLTQGLQSSYSPLTYYRGNIQSTKGNISYSVAITCLFDMGNPDAGILTSDAIRELNPTYIIMFGIAGGIKDLTELGDVIVSTQIFYYEQAKLQAERIEVRPVVIQVDPILKNKLASFAYQSYKTYKVTFGPFAVGEKVVANTLTVDTLRDYEPKLLGIEMESYGVASAARYAFQRPRFIAIRGVSDYADAQKK